VLAEPDFTAISHETRLPGRRFGSPARPAGREPRPEYRHLEARAATRAKCDIFLDNRGDADPDVSRINNTTIDGIPYNTFLTSSRPAD
jgi:hypothetical protein